MENIIINNVIKDDDCEFHRRRKAMQSEYIDFLKRTYDEKNIQLIYLSPYEIKGIERLTEISRVLLP